MQRCAALPARSHQLPSWGKAPHGLTTLEFIFPAEDEFIFPAEDIGGMVNPSHIDQPLNTPLCGDNFA